MLQKKHTQQQVLFDPYYFEFGRYAACRQHLSLPTRVLRLQLTFITTYFCH
jgi:hypothetical protein